MLVLLHLKLEKSLHKGQGRKVRMMMKKYPALWAFALVFSTMSVQAQDKCQYIHLGANVVVDPGLATGSAQRKLVSADREKILAQIRAEAEKNGKKMTAKEISQLTEQADEFARRINRLKNVFDGLQNFNSHFDSVAVYQSRRRLNQLKLDLQMGYKAHAISLYRDLFSSTENAFVKINSNLSILKDTTKVTDQTQALKRENKKLMKVIGENFEEYVSVRSLLEGLSGGETIPDLVIAADPTVPQVDSKAMAREILAELGIPAEHSAIPNLAKPRHRIAMKDLVDFYFQHPEATIAKLKKDIRDNIAIFGRTVILTSPVSIFTKAVDKLPSALATPIHRIMEEFLDMHLLHRYLNQVDDVINAEEGKDAQVSLLRAKNDASDRKDEMLVTFARLTMYTPRWIEIKAHAQKMAQDSGNAIHQDFAQRMEEAEKAALQKRSLAPGYHDMKATVARSVAAGGTGMLLLHYQVQIMNWFERLSGWTTQTLGFVVEATKAMVHFN